MYKAIKVVGEYKVGDVVPNSQAEAWLEMYAVPHVEKVKEQSNVKETEVIEKDAEKTVNNILEDYLERNQSVVKKNLLEDDVTKTQLEQMLKIEKSDKNRPLVINTIKHRLRNI